MPELFKQLSIIIATLRDNFIAIRNENQELRKRYVSLQNEYDKLKNEYDEYKRNPKKTSQEISSNES